MQVPVENLTSESDSKRELLRQMVRCTINDNIFTDTCHFVFVISAFKIGLCARRKSQPNHYYQYNTDRREVVNVFVDSFSGQNILVESAAFSTEDIFAGDWEIFEGVEMKHE